MERIFILSLVLSNAAVIAQAHEHDAERVADIVAMFAEDAIVGTPSIVDCKLSGGTDSHCVAITVTGNPVDHATGPWCPTNIAQAGADVGGVWLDQDTVFEVDGDFIQSLPEIYNDEVWQLYNPETGEVRVTDTLESCTLAARPRVDPGYNNYCVQCELSYMEGKTERTYVIPITPVAADAARPIDDLGAGVALNGVRIDGPAPADAILAAHTIAPFDDCGGHVNLGVGYHYHAVTGCSKEVAAAVTGHAPIIGIAMDGHMLHAQLDANGTEPRDLDVCRGHFVEGIGYHYHANEASQNAIMTCHTAQVGCSNAGSETNCDATQPLRRNRP